MSTAYYIVLDDDEPGFDSFVDGKILTKQLRAVNKIAETCGLKALDEYAFQDLSEFGGPDIDAEWFEGSEGVRWTSAVLAHLREHPGSVRDADQVIDDLQDYQRVFEEADKRGIKWHLELDF